MVGVDNPLVPVRPRVSTGTGGRIRDWEVWAAPRGVLRWLVVVVAVALVLVATSLRTTTVTLGQVATALVLTACAAVCVEAVRRVGEAAGPSNDLLSAWTLPVALLLPPLWSLLVAVVLTVLVQVRVGRSPVYRRVFSAAAIGVSNWVVSTGFHSVRHGHDVVGSGVLDRTAGIALALGFATAGAAVNIALIGTAVRLASPTTTWREQLLDREQRVLDVGEICLGVTVTVCWLVTPLLAVVMLVPVLLVQRSLTHGQLRAAARLDAKTGLLNAVAWQQETDREIVRCRRADRPVAVLIADIDHFKHVNDAHGHLAGDVALRHTVATLLAQLRPSDQLGRFGGEEFTVLLPGAGAVEARAIAERLRQAVAATPVLLDDEVVWLSVSIGAAVTTGPGTTVTDMLAVADHALYRAKGSGRNRVVVET